MKKLIAALSLLFVLSLTACGNSDAALRQENEALRQQILALEAERDNLTKENKDLTEENAALDDTAPESGDDEANPIDRFFEGVDVGSSTAEMNAVADSWAGAWESECRNAAKWLKGQLPLQEDQALVDAYIASAEEQSARMDIMAIYPIADLTLPQTDRSASSAVSGASSGPAPTSKSGKTPFISCSMWPRTMPAARIPPCPISFSLT